MAKKVSDMDNWVVPIVYFHCVSLRNNKNIKILREY